MQLACSVRWSSSTRTPALDSSASYRDPRALRTSVPHTASTELHCSASYNRTRSRSHASELLLVYRFYHPLLLPLRRSPERKQCERRRPSSSTQQIRDSS